MRPPGFSPPSRRAAALRPPSALPTLPSASPLPERDPAGPGLGVPSPAPPRAGLGRASGGRAGRRPCTPRPARGGRRASPGGPGRLPRSGRAQPSRPSRAERPPRARAPAPRFVRFARFERPPGLGRLRRDSGAQASTCASVRLHATRAGKAGGCRGLRLGAGWGGRL